MSNTVKKKLFALLLLVAAAVVCYFCLLNGGMNLQWFGLAAVAAASLLLYVSC